MREVVAVFLFNEETKLLMQLRDDKPSIPYPNHWSLLGGSVEKNESLEQALRREIKEEINYDLGDFKFIGNFDDLFGSWVHLYNSRINKRLDELILTEGQRLEYFSFEETLKIKIPEPLRNFMINNKEAILKRS